MNRFEKISKIITDTQTSNTGATSTVISMVANVMIELIEIAKDHEIRIKQLECHIPVDSDVHVMD